MSDDTRAHSTFHATPVCGLAPANPSGLALANPHSLVCWMVYDEW